MNSTPSPFDAVGEDGTIRLPAHATTVTAEDLRIHLVLAADYRDRTEIDASGLESIGQAVLQLMVAARRDAGEAGQQFAIFDPSPAFVARVGACRLADAIGLATDKEVAQ